MAPLLFLCLLALIATDDAETAVAEYVRNGSTAIEGKVGDAELAKAGRGSGGAQKACFAEAGPRGPGKAVSWCPGRHERDGLLCYRRCRGGYKGVGPVCWEECPDGLDDRGLLCAKTFGKGCCCTAFGCCGCHHHQRLSPAANLTDIGANFTDMGCFCSRTHLKHSYGRGAGKPMSCAPDQEKSGALCYDKCPPNRAHGVGPLCWARTTPLGFPTRCNDFIWAVDDYTCNILKKEMGLGDTLGMACFGFVIASMLAIVGWPLAAAVCSIGLPEAISAINTIVEKTGAKACA